MDQVHKDFKVVALIESDTLENDFLRLLNPYKLSSFEKSPENSNIHLELSHQSQEEEKSTTDFLTQKTLEADATNPCCIRIQYQGKSVRISARCLDHDDKNLFESIGDMANADRILLVFNETEEATVRLQRLMSSLGKVIPEELRKNIVLLFKANNEESKFNNVQAFTGLTIDERNAFRYRSEFKGGEESDDKKIISNLLDKVFEEKSRDKFYIKRGLVEKPEMAVWKKEDFLKNFQKKRQFSRKLFYFSYSYMPMEENFRILKKSLVKSRFLREVNCDFTETQMFSRTNAESDRIFKNFCEGFRKQNCLKVLKFKSGYQIGDEKFEYLAKNFKQLSSLETLHLQYNFLGQASLFHDKPGDLLSNAITKCNSLKHLYLTMNIEDFDLTPLVCTLKRLSRLESVHLDLKCSSSARSTEESWKKLSETLQKIPFVKTFKFRRMHQLPQEGIANLSLRYISETLAAFDSLQEISLDFNGNIITDESLIYLSDAIKKQHSLQKLTLLFANCELLTNQGLINLSTSLAPLNNLKSLFLNLNFCYDLDDTFLNSLGNNLETLNSLQNLKLWIIWCRNMSEEALENFEKKLKGKKSLKDLVIRT